MVKLAAATSESAFDQRRFREVTVATLGYG
jgi:hypothetical protein